MIKKKGEKRKKAEKEGKPRADGSRVDCLWFRIRGYDLNLRGNKRKEKTEKRRKNPIGGAYEG